MEKRYKLIIAVLLVCIGTLALYAFTPFRHIPDLWSFSVDCQYDSFGIETGAGRSVLINEDWEIVGSSHYGPIAYKLNLFERIKVYNTLMIKNRILLRADSIIDKNILDIDWVTLTEDDLIMENVSFAENIIFKISYYDFTRTIHVARYNSDDTLWAKNIHSFLYELWEKHYNKEKKAITKKNGN